MAGKISDDQIFEAEKKMKKYETIIGAMSEEERSDPDLITRTGGNKEKLLEAADRRARLAEATGLGKIEIDSFLFEFAGMRKMMVQNLKVLPYQVVLVHSL
jgi:signal recognition particle subunit SRP54